MDQQYCITTGVRCSEASAEMSVGCRFENAPLIEESWDREGRSSEGTDAGRFPDLLNAANRIVARSEISLSDFEREKRQRSGDVVAL